MPVNTLKQPGRQTVLVAEVAIGVADLTTTVAAEAMDIPYNAIVVGGELVVDTVWNSATSDVLDIGDGVDDDRYTASQIDLTALGRTALTLTTYKYGARDTIDVIWTGTGAAPTTGAARLYVHYIIADRASENVSMDITQYGASRAP